MGLLSQSRTDMSDSRFITEKRVKEANRRLYDAAADSYETIDGRRSVRLADWMKDTLAQIQASVSGQRLLDIGAGSGFVTRCAKGIFAERIAVDLSPKILAVHRDSFDLGICADADQLPLADESVDVVTCFAVLHHVYDLNSLLKEISRVLRKGGIFYSDHDMSVSFSTRFRPLLSLYRRFNNAAARYGRVLGGNEEIYRLSEHRPDGIDARHLQGLLEKEGFTCRLRYHWFGLNVITDMIFAKSGWPEGFGPLASILAVKK
jgi:ubiquinone/menaquinone biosynthesis C-methylase UbiE